MRSFLRIPVAAAAALLVAACAQARPAPVEPAPPPPVAAAAVRTGLPGPLTPRLEQSNADGVKVRIERITFEPERILIDLVVRNGSPGAVALASSPYTGMTLRDDLGGSYNFQVPQRNKAVRVLPGDTYEAQVVFAGSLPPDATSLTLVTNAGSRGDRFVPRFEFPAIPVP